MPFVKGYLELVATPGEPSGPVDPGYGQPTPPDVIWGGRPPGYYPPGFWPGSPPPRPHPTPPPVISGGPGSLPPFVMPPIVLPPGFIDGVHPEHPIVIVPPSDGNHPMLPIVIPPDLGIWGPTDPRPTNPIVIPPPTPTYPPQPTHPIVLPDPPTDGGEPKPPQIMKNWDVVAYWTEEGGWAVAVVPSEEHPGVPTPAAAPARP